MSDPLSGIPIVDWFIDLLDQFGYLIVFGFTIFENLFVAGSLTPGETIVIAAAFVASLGRLALPLVWLSSVLGTVVGSNISYWFGRRAGRQAIVALGVRVERTWIGRLVKLDEQSIAASEQYFVDHGAKTVLIARFAVGIKNWVPTLAGASHMSIFWFEFYTLAGAVLYTSLMCAIGWFVGANLDVALSIASSIGWVGLFMLVLLVVAIYFARRRLRAGLPPDEDGLPDSSEEVAETLREHEECEDQ
jgi:membrane-associated protein